MLIPTQWSLYLLDNSKTSKWQVSGNKKKGNLGVNKSSVHCPVLSAVDFLLSIFLITDRWSLQIKVKHLQLEQKKDGKKLLENVEGKKVGSTVRFKSA